MKLKITFLLKVKCGTQRFFIYWHKFLTHYWLPPPPSPKDFNSPKPPFISLVPFRLYNTLLDLWEHYCWHRLIFCTCINQEGKDMSEKKSVKVYICVLVVWLKQCSFRNVVSGPEHSKTIWLAWLVSKRIILSYYIISSYFYVVSVAYLLVQKCVLEQ